MNTLDMDVAAPTGSNDHKSVAASKARFGVVRLGNAYGSEVLPLRVPMEVQYWNGNLFQTNYDDSSTTFSSGNFLMSNCLRNIATNNACAGNRTALSPASITLVNGRANLILAAPGRGNAGSLDLCLDLGADAHSPGYTCSATSAGMTYLQGPWGGATNDYDPKSRATFGIYKRNNEMIYLRENY
jgi:MSHA biogenesis protein MshQ